MAAIRVTRAVEAVCKDGRRTRAVCRSATLGRASYALGDDNGAAAAHGEAAELIEAFASTLSPERATRFLQAPAIVEIRSA